MGMHRQAVYQALHRRHGIPDSMTGGYGCYPNALAERVNGSLQGEFQVHRPSDLQQTRRMVAQAVEMAIAASDRICR